MCMSYRLITSKLVTNIKRIMTVMLHMPQGFRQQIALQNNVFGPTCRRTHDIFLPV